MTFPTKQASVYRAFLVAAGLAMLTGVGWAEDAAAPAPPKLPPLGKTLEDLLKDSKYKYASVDSAEQSQSFDVQVPCNEGKSICRIRASEKSVSWSGRPDVRFFSLWTNVNDVSWSRSIAIPPALVRAVNNANDTTNWISYSIHENPDRSWSISCHCQVFMKGMSAEVFKDYLDLVCEAARTRAAEFQQFIVDDDAGPATK